MATAIGSSSSSSSLPMSAPRQSDRILLKIQGFLKHNPSTEELKVTFQELENWIPDLSEEKMGFLESKLRILLSLSPTFITEQGQLAALLGDWGLKYTPHGLRHLFYYAIALNLDESKELHQSLSTAFIRWVIVQKKFKSRLEQAYNLGDSDLFHQILDQLEHAKSLCLDQADVNALYDQADQVLIEGAKETRLHSFATCADRVYRLDRTLSPGEYISQRYRQGLKTYRSSFTYREINPIESFKKFFYELLEDAFAIIGSPPCKYDLRAMGSIGRLRPGPYSDLEWFILIENEKHIPYFKQLAEIVNLQFIMLGETASKDIPVFTAQGTEHPSGLHFDTNPAESDTLPLIATPQHLAQAISTFDSNSNTEDFLAHSMLHSISLKTDDPNLEQELLSSIIQEARAGHASRAIDNRRESFKRTWMTAPDLLKEFQLKKEFIELFDLLIADLGSYFGIPSPDLLEIIDHLEIDNRAFMKEALNGIYQIRIRRHLLERMQVDTVSKQRLASDETALVCATYWLILRPLYHGLDKILGGERIDLFQQALTAQDKENIRPLIPHLVRILVQSQCSLEKHRSYFLQLQSSILRVDYLTELEKFQVDVGSLADIPADDGMQYTYVQDARALRVSIKQMTTQTPTTLRVRCSFLDEAYIKEEYVQRLTDPKQKIGGCLHDVHSLEDCGLHFKEKPSEPLKEYAVHSLTSRIMGHGTPPTELICLESPSQRPLPVLVSKTIPGKTLKECSLNEQLDNAYFTWLLLCTLLTKPGDGRASNYVLTPDGKIFCIDNDVSFFEPVLAGIVFNYTQFSSVLFCFNKQQPLDPEVIAQFVSLDPEAILKGWIEDLIEKEKEYVSLFPEQERKEFFEKDPNKSFTPFFLIKEGTLSSLCFQFYHLQHILRLNEKPLFPIDLLDFLVTLKNDVSQSVVGPIVKKAYTKALYQKTLRDRLGKAIGKSQTQSMTASQAHQTSLGKVPTTEEIEKKKTFSLERAKQELFSLVEKSSLSEGGAIIGRNYQCALFADFATIGSNEAPDLPRQEVILNRLLWQVQNRYFEELEEVTLSNCAVLTDKTLIPFLGPKLRVLNLRYCLQLTYAAVAEIAQRSPNLEELYLSGTKIKGFAKWGLLAWQPIAMPSLRILHLSRCPKLQAINLESNRMAFLKARESPKLTELNSNHFLRKKVDLEGSPVNRGAVLDGVDMKQINKTILKLYIEALLADRFAGANQEHYWFHILSNALGEYFGRSELEELIKHPRTKPLKKIDLSHVDLGAFTYSYNIYFLEKGLKPHLSTIKTIKLSSCGLSDRELLPLIKIIPKCTALKTLDLSNNLIGDSGAQAIARALAANENFGKKYGFVTSENQVNLSGNHFKDAGIRALVSVFTEYKSFALDIGWVDVYQEGTERLITEVKRSNDRIHFRCSVTFLGERQKKADSDTYGSSSFNSPISTRSRFDDDY